jgi:hypothetical protein
MPTVNLAAYQDVLNRVTREVLESMPESWNKATLTIEFDGRSLHYRLENDADPTRPNLTQDLPQLCGELYVRMEIDGQPFSRCVMELKQAPEGHWSVNLEFKHPEGKHAARRQ